MWGWRPALRIASREARRAKRRSLLVTALIGLPVAGLAFAAISYDSFRLTPEQELARELGAADAVVEWVADGPVTQPADGLGHAPAAADAPLRTGPVTGPELLAVLPAGSRVVPLRPAELTMTTSGGVGTLAVEEVDLSDPIHAGRLVLRHGTAPATSDEVALTRPAADRLGAGIGDRVQTADGARSWRVVGIAEDPERLRSHLMLYPATEPGDAQRWLVDAPAPVTWEQVQSLNRHGLVVRSRAVVLDPPAPEQLHPDWRFYTPGDGDSPVIAIGVLVAGLALLEVVLLAGPAFAVGARQRRRDLGLVAAAGGTTAHLRRIVLADGVVLGLAGAAVGLLIGAAAAAAGLPLMEEHLLASRSGGLRLWPPALAGIASVSVLTGVLAALVPAVMASRQPVVAALTGRRGATVTRRRWVVAGLVTSGAGAAIALAGAWWSSAGVILAGLVLGQLGLVLCTPALVGLLARTGPRLPLPARIALRDTARNRFAAAPAISAVMAAVAGSLTIGVYIASDSSRMSEIYTPSVPPGYVYLSYDSTEQAAHHDRVEAAFRRSLPVRETAAVWVPTCPEDPDAGCAPYVDVAVPVENQCPGWDDDHELTAEEQRAARTDHRCRGIYNIIWGGAAFPAVVDDGTALAALTAASADEVAEATQVLRSGGIVVTDPRLVADGRATLVAQTYPEGGGDTTDTGRLTTSAYVLTSAESGRLFLGPEALAELGLDRRLGGLIGTTDEAPPLARQDAAGAVLQAIDPALPWPQVERGTLGFNRATIVALAIAAGMVALGATAIATGLAAEDRRGDLATLGAVGASPRMRRLLSLSQSGVIAGLGTALGAVTGIGSAFTILLALNLGGQRNWPPPPPYPIEVPWLAVLVLLAVPTVSMLGAGLLTRARLPIERRPT